MRRPLATNGDATIRAAIDLAREPTEPPPPAERGNGKYSKPTLVIQGANLPATVRALRDLLAAQAPELYDRDRVLVLLARDAATDHLHTRLMTANNVIMLAHDYCQPVKYDKKGNEYKVTLPGDVAKMYLDHGNWHVRPLAGITTCPLMRDDGGIISSEGYDVATQFYVDAPPDVTVPERPSDEQAQAALLLLRETYQTFPFADAVLVPGGDGLDYVDLTLDPGLDESSWLTAVLTGVARASLWLAPGVLVVAPQHSGSGAGKGLLLCSVSVIAFGMRSEPITAGHSDEELDKRITSELLRGGSFIQIDNVNNMVLRSETLSSAQTERPIRIRPMGTNRSDRVNAAPFIGLTGNAVSVSEDQCRRMLQVHIDPKMENPDTRPFKPGFVDGINSRRAELLSACLTILRWSRQRRADDKGLPVGSYEMWAEWVRDPLLALGCKDAVEAMHQAKLLDPRRIKLAQMYETWWENHRDDAVTVADLHHAVQKVIDPKDLGRQFRESFVRNSVGARQAGYVLHRHTTGAAWNVAKYTLERVSGATKPLWYL